MNIFLIADTHFGHLGSCQFLNYDGTKMRPWSDPDEMDEALVANWNDSVRPKDKVYHLGDVAINRRGLKVLDRLNGEKVLIKGNHDIFQLDDYVPRFKDIRAYHVLDRLILSHIPIHEDSKARFKGNVHGHLHANKLDDPFYTCVSVEQINYRPIPFEEIRARYSIPEESKE